MHPGGRAYCPPGIQCRRRGSINFLVLRRAGGPHPAARSCAALLVKPVRKLAVAIRNTTASVHAAGGSLSFCGERKGGKNAAKTKVLESFPRLRCRLHRFLSATRLRHSANFLPCFRIASASPSATRSALVLADLTGAPSAYAVRRREGTPPYEYFEGWCHRADVGIGPNGNLSVNDS